MIRPPMRIVHPFKRVPASPGANSGSSSNCVLVWTGTWIEMLKWDKRRVKGVMWVV